jgi:hypothetical protein
MNIKAPIKTQGLPPKHQISTNPLIEKLGQRAISSKTSTITGITTIERKSNPNFKASMFSPENNQSSFTYYGRKFGPTSEFQVSDTLPNVDNIKTKPKYAVEEKMNNICKEEFSDLIGVPVLATSK